MGSIFRSEDMALCQFIIPAEATYSCMSALGEVGKVYFRDLNPDVNPFQRNFVNEIKRCEEIEKHLRRFQKELTRDEIKIVKVSDPPPAAPPYGELNDIEADVDKLARSLDDVNTNLESLNRNMNELIELRYILEKTHHIFDEREIDLGFAHTDVEAILPPGENVKTEFGYVTGIICRSHMNGFERFLWRACHGNAYFRHEPVEIVIIDPNTREPIEKEVFIIFYQGDQLAGKIKKICDGFHATVYPIPDMAQERKEMLKGVIERIMDLSSIVSQSEDHRTKILMSAGEGLRAWMFKTRKVKAIFTTMDKLDYDVTHTLLVGDGWVPVCDLELVRQTLIEGQERSGCSVPAMMNQMDYGKLIPPTHFRNNKFTKIFQSIVNAYGIPRYKEINPALYTTITFPFLFAVMFGDAGDAVLLILGALAMISFEGKLSKRIEKDVFSMFFNGRYIILLMGCFSVYSGLIYNDVFSVSVNIFGSRWIPSKAKYNISTDLAQVSSFELNPNLGTDYTGYPYPFGMDPVWQLSENSITWLNSFKMKMSVLFGVTHMFFGICLSLFNNIYDRNYVNIFCEFIPQVIFIACIFGYMNILIVYKWFAYGAANAACSPTILVDMISMFLFQYPSSPCYSATFYPNQKQVQSLLILVALVCVFWILLPKPFIIKCLHNREVKREMLEQSNTNVVAGGSNEKARVHPVQKGAGGYENFQTKEQNGEGGYENIQMHDSKLGGETIVVEMDGTKPKDTRSKAHRDRPDEPDEEPFEFGEVFVHQAIHTIEYCLGCVSHTASYLRLWALSLAHAELALVLWDMVLRFGFVTKGYGGVGAQFVLFPVWAVLTLAILLLMEGLSAFLHTLRLHWVEFQSKFYIGTGHKFIPFHFNKIIQKMWEEYLDF